MFLNILFINLFVRERESKYKRGGQGTFSTEPHVELDLTPKPRAGVRHATGTATQALPPRVLLKQHQHSEPEPATAAFQRTHFPKTQTCETQRGTDCPSVSSDP